MASLIGTISDHWWVPLLRGIVAVLFGFMALAWPVLTLGVLVLLFGAYALVDGVVAVIGAVRYRDRVERWWLWLITGVLGIVFGVLTFFWPGVTALVLLWFIAGWAILTGISEVLAAVQFRKAIEGEWLLGLAGVLSVLFGVALLVWPGAGLLSLAWLIGAYALVTGVALVVLAFRLRSL
ncbi:HdeD family acid-resistance protein [Rubrivirga sp. S365]|uniref:HdeD family acid-resistance protein n=1 Tax=Rubrivirga litoralis TaxID=3075598 RepID=A0ABU3BT42_9BACT|nr:MULTISPECIES: HdeD family acid-resistance protein [unclassified Rubrivirga]MDT0632457.1 HdeD family acid-resistance protein [Rubrivirga sp. F394]MDT7857106.1 HdeD family acid-resistance protein [Rubrivirga sp. S365]